MRPARMSAAVVFLFVVTALSRAYAASGTASADGMDIGTLRTASESCVFCHVKTAEGAKVVYGGDPAQYLGAGPGAAHTAAQTPCLVCHVSHGESGMGGPVASKLLRVLPYQRELVDDLAGGDAAAITAGTARAAGWDARSIQITAFCSACHPVFARSSAEDVPVEEPGDAGATITRLYADHPLTVARSGAERAGEARARGLRLAARDSLGCRACHGAGVTDASTGDLTANWPHSTPTAAGFLLSAADASSPATGAASAEMDGVCLRCHRWRSDGATRGVGSDW